MPHLRPGPGLLTLRAMRTLTRFLLALWLLASAPVGAQIHAGEDSDAGVAPAAALRQGGFSAPTPLEIPGARRLLTEELRSMRWRADPPLLFDVLGGELHDSLPGAIWLPGAGRGRGFDDEIQKQLARVLDTAAQGSLNRALVFFCANKGCWLSYNAALRAVRLGYKEVYWYRGGIEAWIAAGEPLAPLKMSWQKPPEGG